jgi:two-component system response regulator FixJ
MAVQAMKAGALDFIEKPFDDQVLIDAIDRAIASVEKSSSGADNGSAVRLRFGQLTEREKQVMKGIVAGQANKTIAYDLDISPRTVEVHRANVMAKMQAKSLPDLVRMVLSADLPH